MKYNRKQRSSNPIDILKFETVETGAVFKQYDVNTSILEIALVANGEPVRIDNSFKIYATVKPRQRSAYDVLYRYSEDYEENETSNYKILLNAEKMKVRSLNNMINLYLSPLALSFSGDMVAELILVDLENQQRVTSQEFIFKIEPSLTPNQEEDISYTVIEDLGGTYITDSEELKLLAIDGVSGFKLSFTGLEVNEILQSVQGLNYEENNEALESLNQKDEEIQESIKAATKEREKINSEIILLKNKDLELDTKIEQLNLYNSTNDLNINEIKSDLSKLEEYNSSNDIKIQTIDREIESLKEYDSSNSTKIQSIENEIRSLKKYDETNTSSINEIKEDIVNLKLYNSSNDESIRNINSNIADFKQYNSNNTEVVNGIKSDLQSYKSSNNQAVSDVRENLESYKTSNNQSVNSINENLENFKNTTNQTINDINVDISSLKDYNTINDSKIEEMNRSIERNTNSISENLQKIDSNTSLIEVNKEAISSINLKNEEIERDLTSSKENIENNKNDILNLNKKVNKNTEDIKLLKEGSIGGSSSNSNKEVIDARTATTGEVFDTLDERIDHEVDRLNKKIDVTMLQQEDKENHVIENTVDGMTNDMVVKGKTLQNLIKDGRGTFTIDKSINEYSRIKVFKTTLPLKVGKEYTGYLVVDNLENSERWLSIYGYKKDETTASIYGNVRKKNDLGVVKFTWTPNNGNIDTFDTIGIYIESTDFNNGAKATFSDFMLFEEGTDLTNIDKHFEGIKSFGQEEDKIVELSHGKNLAELDLSNENITIFEDGYRLDCLALYRRDEDIFNWKGKYKENTQYVLSYYGKILDNSNANNYRVRVYYTDDSYTDGVVTGKEYEKRVIVTSSGKTVYKIIGYYEAMGGDFIVKDVMLEEGAQATTYEPYKFYKKDISLLELGFDEGLRGLNNIVYDELSSIKNVAIKRIEKHTMTGNEQLTVKLRGDYIYCNCILKGSVPRYGTEAICNKFIYIDGLWNQDDPKVQNKEGFDLSGGNSLSFQIPISKLENTNEEGIKKYFKSLHDSGNPVIVYYELEEPIETPLDENINLKTFEERTYVTFENAISGTSSFKAPVDSATTIARLNRENRALEEENKNLRQDFESTTLSLTDSDLELVKQNVDMDFRLMEVEFALDIPQSTLSSNINFKNKKGEVKSMARTPYEMMKIVILSGDYDREDYIHKVRKYYERGRMTKEEHDELMSLMTADEVISKKN